MPGEVHIAPSARRDLHEIISYLLAERPSAAVKFLERFEKLIARLVDHPHLGPVSQHPRREGLRKLALPPHVIFYRVTPHRIELVRVVHAARDLDDGELVSN